MAHPEKGEITLTFGGTAYRFKLGTSALIDLQEFFSTPDVTARLAAEAEARRLRDALAQFGRHADACRPAKGCTCGYAAAVADAPVRPSVASIEDIIREVSGGRLKYVRAFLWAGLQQFHRGTTLDDVSAILDEADEHEVRTLLHQMGLTTAPDPRDVEELKKDAPADPRRAQVKTRRGTGGSSKSRPAASA